MKKSHAKSTLGTQRLHYFLRSTQQLSKYVAQVNKFRTNYRHDKHYYASDQSTPTIEESQQAHNPP